MGRIQETPQSVKSAHDRVRREANDSATQQAQRQRARPQSRVDSVNHERLEGCVRIENWRAPA